MSAWDEGLASPCYTWGVLVVQRAAAQAPGLGGSVELVDPKVFRICADPRNLPFSDEQGGGFENKIAELFAKKLNEPTSYTYYPQVIGFVRNTLNALRCDVVMGTAVGDTTVQTTNPYYRTTYALVFKPNSGLDGIVSLEDPRLKDKHIGIVAGTPPATILSRNGLMVGAKPYPLTVDTRTTSSPQMMTDDIEAGRIDAGVLWGPMAGYYAQRMTPHLVVVPLLKEGAQMDFSHRHGGATDRSGLEAKAQSIDYGESAGDRQDSGRLRGSVAGRAGSA